MATEQRECRICLSAKNDSNSGFYIDLNSSSVFQPFQQILLNLTGIDVFEYKDISSWICDQCENKLMDFDCFRKKCRESNNVFLKRAGIKTILDENPKESELSLLERLDRIHIENIKIQSIKLDSIQVDLAEKENDLSENVPELGENPKESELRLFKRLDVEDINKQTGFEQKDPFTVDINEENDASKQEEKSGLSLLERLEKIESSDEKGAGVKQGITLQVVDPVKVNLSEKEKDLFKNASKPLKVQPGFEGYLKVYMCPYCPKYFQRDIHLVGSLMEHINKDHRIKKTLINKNECTICYRVLMDQIALEEHIVSSHIKYCCENCEQFFPLHMRSCRLKEAHKRDIKHHLVESVKVEVVPSVKNQSFEGFQKVYICLHCPTKCQFFDYLLKHLHDAHPNLLKKTQIFKNECQICYKVLLNPMSLQEHIASKHIKHCCNKCNELFQDNEVPMHERSCRQKTKANNHVVGPVNVFEKEKDLSKNVPSVINQSIEEFQKVYICLHCSTTYSFESFGSLIEHLKIDHPNLIKKTPLVKHECPICYKVLLDRMSLEAHIASSHVKQRCNKCNSIFWDVRQHQNSCPFFNSKATKEMKMNSVENTSLIPLKDCTTNCRTCLATTKEGKHFIDIFHSTFYPEMFLCCTGIDINSTPRMTTWMCGECETKLTSFYNFQRKCWESDLVLRKIPK